jgi:hypothetical protein
MNVVKRVELRMKTGDVMTIDVSDRLLENVRQAFDLTDNSQVTDRHVKYFLASSMRNMLEVTDGTKPD